MRDTRKPVMSEARRKVLNLLEFCLESDPWCYSVGELIRGVCYVDVARDISDEELAEALQDYADEMLKANKETQHDL